jgi:glycosyltransferase involved in cell wall biosynthesis
MVTTTEMNTNESKIKLLYITTHPLTQLLFLRGQNEFLTHAGFQLYSITSQEKYFDELAQGNSFTIYPVEISGEIVPHKDLFALVRIFLIIRKLKPDIVHLSNPKAALLGAIAAWAAKIKVRIFLVRGLTSDAKTGFSKSIYEYLEWITARFCNFHWAVSNSLLNQLRKKNILKDYEGLVIGPGMSNGVDCQLFSRVNVNKNHRLEAFRHELGLSSDAQVIGYVGRLTSDKGLLELSEAWQVLRRDFPNSYLLLVGEWWEGVDVVPRRIRVALDNDERVRVTGHVGDPAPYYSLMTVLAFPSYREGFPNAVMEAAAMELPVVAASVVGSVDAVIDGDTGTLVEPRNPEALAKAISRYLSDPILCERHGKAGRDRVEKFFRQEVIWEAFLNKYLEILDKHAHSRPLRS